MLSYPDGLASSAFEQLVSSLKQTFPTELYTYRTRHPPAWLGQRWFALLIAIHAMVCKEVGSALINSATNIAFTPHGHG